MTQLTNGEEYKGIGTWPPANTAPTIAEQAKYYMDHKVEKAPTVGEILKAKIDAVNQQAAYASLQAREKAKYYEDKMRVTHEDVMRSIHADLRIEHEVRAQGALVSAEKAEAYKRWCVEFGVPVPEGGSHITWPKIETDDAVRVKLAGRQLSVHDEKNEVCIDSTTLELLAKTLGMKLVRPEEPKGKESFPPDSLAVKQMGVVSPLGGSRMGAFLWMAQD